VTRDTDSGERSPLQSMLRAFVEIGDFC